MAVWFRFVVLSRPQLLQGLQVWCVCLWVGGLSRKAWCGCECICVWMAVGVWVGIGVGCIELCMVPPGPLQLLSLTTPYYQEHYTDIHVSFS